MRAEATEKIRRADPVRRRPNARDRLIVGLAIVGLALAGLGAGIVGAFQWNRVVEYRTPFAFDVRPGPDTVPLADHVVLVVVDGLRLDEARDLPAFSRLGEEGSFLSARASQPSFSLPGWTTLTTGAPPEISGVTTNFYEGRVLVDSILAGTREAGVTSAVAGSVGWRQLYGHVVDRAFYADEEDGPVTDREIGAAALRFLSEDPPGLLVVHLPEVDKRGHESGVGEAYREAARRADRIVADVVEAAPDGTAFVLTSDHGHVDDGGHGGPEREVIETPFVLAGEGLVPGASGEISHADVAPTIAALLGTPRPAHAVGALRPSLLDADDEERREIVAAHEEVERRFYAVATGVVSGEGDTRVAFEGAREDRLRHDVIARLPIVLAALALAAIAVALSTQRLDAPAILAGAATFFVVWIGLFLARGLTFSLSHFNTEDQVRPFLLFRLLDAVIAIVVAGIVTGLVAGRRGRVGAFRTSLGMVAWVMLVISMGVAAFLTIFGWAFSWRLPDMSAVFAQFLALIALAGVGGAAWLGALTALGVARLVAPRRG